jgi:hypothetical protein
MPSPPIEKKSLIDGRHLGFWRRRENLVEAHQEVSHRRKSKGEKEAGGLFEIGHLTRVQPMTNGRLKLRDMW